MKRLSRRHHLLKLVVLIGLTAPVGAAAQGLSIGLWNDDFCAFADEFARFAMTERQAGRSARAISEEVKANLRADPLFASLDSEENDVLNRFTSGVIKEVFDVWVRSSQTGKLDVTEDYANHVYVHCVEQSF